MNEEGGLLVKKEYNLSIGDFNDTGRVVRPDGSFVALDKVSIERNGKSVRIISYDYANQTLGVAICSCGEQVDGTRITMTLEDGSVFLPALCCGKAIFFDGDVE